MELLMAGLFAAALAFTELKRALHRQRIPLGAMHWVVARMGVDGILGVIGREGKRLGVGDRYQNWLKVVADEISDISSNAQAKWLWNRIMPKLGAFELQSLRNRASTYLRARQQAGQLTAKKVEEYEAYIDRIISDASTGDDEKRAALMQALVDRGGRRFVAGLARSAKSEHRRMKLSKVEARTPDTNHSEEPEATLQMGRALDVDPRPEAEDVVVVLLDWNLSTRHVVIKEMDLVFNARSGSSTKCGPGARSGRRGVDYRRVAGGRTNHRHVEDAHLRRGVQPVHACRHQQRT